MSSRNGSGFLHNTRGSVGMMFAFAIVPILVGVGCTVDYARALAVRTALQQSADAGALAGANAQGLLNSGREQLAVSTFSANATGKPMTAAANATATVFATGITVASQFNVPTMFMRVIGMDTIPVNVSSTVTFIGRKIELALMVDITGSMADVRNGAAKIDGLKTAAQDLLDIMMPVGAPDTTRISLVPFASYVNAGTYASTVTGLPDTRNHAGATQQLITCVTERTGTETYSDELPGPSQWITASTQGANSANYSADGACNRPTGGGSSLPVPEIMPLTTDKAALLDKINAFEPGGSTAGHLGTAWAWYTLSPKWNSIWPTGSQPVAYDNQEYVKAVVLMTDGEYNTQYSNADSKTQAVALCTAMKAAGVTVYTVGFGFDPNSSSDDVARNTLTQCASGADYYFFPYDGDALRQTFVQIGNHVSVIAGRGRLTQ